VDRGAVAYDGGRGTAGGVQVGAAIAAVAAEREVDLATLATTSGLGAERLAAVIAGAERLTVPDLARLAQALRLRAIEFLQKSAILSLEVYAAGLDPLYFLPVGPTRFDARIYMREINPRHAVPERDMTKRNPTLKALAEDALLDPLGRLELELSYLLRAAVQSTGGTL